MQHKRSGQITANITPERIREGLVAGHRVYVKGHDFYFDCSMEGEVQTMDNIQGCWNVAFIDETSGSRFEGKRVGLNIDQLSDVVIDA